MIEAKTAQIDISPSHSQVEKIQAVVLIESNGLKEDNEDGYVESVLNHPTRTTFVARDAGRVVGAAVIQEASGSYFGLNYIAVEQAYRGNRIADRLLEMSEDFIRSRGGSRLTLIVHDNDPKLVEFYERRGFEKQLGLPIEMQKRL